MAESVDENAEGKLLAKEISELRSTKKELLRSVSDELERIAQRERQCVDKLHRITSKKHNREQYQQIVQRLIELESQLKRLKCENDKLSDKNEELKLSLDQAAKYWKIQRHKLDSMVKVAKQSEIPDITVSVLQKQLSENRKLLIETKEELNETRQRLSDVHQRLTVAEQVTAATQQRAIQESDNSEELQLELTSQHHQPTSDTGDVLIS